MKKAIRPVILLLIGCLLSGCGSSGDDNSAKSIIPSWMPKPAAYPYKDPELLKAKLQEISEDLKAYINDWANGSVDAMIPESILPPGIYRDEMSYMNPSALHPNIRGIHLVNPDTTDQNDYWYVRKAKILDPEILHAQNADYHCTYLINYYLVPLNTLTVMQGQFPHCRFFMFTPTAPFSGKQYNFSVFGPQEVPLVDVDVIPDAGSVNPFLPGANRNATNRSYTVKFLSMIGDPAQVGNKYSPLPPHYREYEVDGSGAPIMSADPNVNTRYTNSILCKGLGPYGTLPVGVTADQWQGGVIWGRYYLPDNWGAPGFDPRAGVPLPKMYHRLDNGSGAKFLTMCDMAYYRTNLDATFSPLVQNNEPDPRLQSGSVGWNKMWGILDSMVSYTLYEWGNPVESDKKYIRDFLLGMEGRAYDRPAPANWEGSATCVPYINYLVRSIRCPAGKVIVLTGKLPNFPKTMSGNATMETGDLRYWSITANESLALDSSLQGNSSTRQAGITTSSIVDEEVVLDSDRRYILCYSRIADRPTNAVSSNKVTWINWGVNSNTHFTLRWMSVYPNWSFSKTPDMVNLTWDTTSWLCPDYNDTLIGKNSHDGWMGEYLPKMYYMNRNCFEQMGSQVTWENLNAYGWNQNCTKDAQ